MRLESRVDICMENQRGTQSRNSVATNLMADETTTTPRARRSIAVSNFSKLKSKENKG